MTGMTNRTTLLVRIGIGVMVLDHLYNGFWGLVAPESYYRNLHGAMRSGATDNLNQVLVRDLSVGRLTLALVLLWAAVTMSRIVLVVALAAAELSGVLRFVDHVLSHTGDQLPNWIGYTTAVVLPAVLLWVCVRGQGRSHR